MRIAPGRRRVLRIAVLLSVACHLAAVALIVLLPRVMPQEARPQEQGTVELLMVEQKGAEASPGGQPQEAKPAPVRPAQPDQAAPTQAAEAAPPVAPPPPPRNGDEPAPAQAQPPTPSPAKPEAQQAANQIAAPSAPTRAPEAPVFDFEGTESESNAIVLGGGHVLPAMRDDRFRNRPPIYPVEAEMRGDHGSVLVVIHVSETGIAAGVDVAESSGVSSLDQAAVAAVQKWHFRPAMKAGHTVPFDMPFRFIFQAD